MFKRLALILLILALIPLSASAVDSPKEAELQLLLDQALIQYQDAQDIVRRDLSDPRWPRLVDDSWPRMVDACMDYIRLYGRKHLHKYMINKLTEIARELYAEFRDNPYVYLHEVKTITNFFENAVTEAQDNINKGAPSPLAKPQSSPALKPRISRITIVPDVLGIKLEQAKEILEKAGLIVGRIAYISVIGKPWDVILAQDPRPGKKIPRSFGVNLTINTESEESPQTHRKDTNP